LDKRPATVIIDLDGVVLKHRGSLSGILDKTPELLPMAKEKFDEWEAKGYRIVITTGRKESMRQHTEAELAHMGLFYDVLVMGLGGGKRYLINDKKANGDETAFAVNLPRDQGLCDVQI
jgi:hydroxymethylpyrimidine pyrophosphatase-like HAD family hydrolase